LLTKNQTFHYTRRITPKRVMSLRCPSPRHSAKGNTAMLPIVYIFINLLLLLDEIFLIW